MISTLAAHASQYPNGWGGPIAIAIPFLLLWAATTGYGRWKESRQEAVLPSAEKKTLGAVKPQASADSDSPDSTPGDGGGEVVPIRSKPVEDFIAERADKQNSSQLVREAVARFRVSEATAWRLLRKVRGDGGAA